MQICSRCVYNSTFSGISFNMEGVCSYCEQVDNLCEQYGTGQEKGQNFFDKILLEIKESGRKAKYDCIVGVSGGTDSSYLLMKCKDWGLRPLAVHYDNTWNTAVSTENIRKITTALGVDLYTHVVDNKEADDLYRATFYAGVPEWDCSSDIAFVQVLRNTAAKFRVGYILEGHSFMAEGISPVSNNYFDGKYIEDIHDRYGRVPMRTFPNLTFFRFLKWAIIYRQKFIRPFWYLKYSKEAARDELIERTGWRYYGGHHLENRAAIFGHMIYLPQKFNIDYRFLTLAASARSGRLSREEALAEYAKPIEVNKEILSFVKKRLDLNDEEYEMLMTAPNRSFRDFKTYKKRFELLRPIFFILAQANLVPMSFYLKYCFPLGSKT